MTSGTIDREQPFFSIIIPTFNSAATINNAIESILRQTCSDFEIVIIDGGSTDNTRERIEAFGSGKLKITSEKDNGIYDAMNKGIQKAKGMWLYFLGSDDTLFSEKVLAQVSAVISESDYFVYGDVKINGNAQWAKDNDIYDGEFTLEKLMRKNICHQSIFYNREIILSNRIFFKQEYPVCGDWDFNLKCWSIRPFKYIPIIISNFNAGGISTRATVIDTFSDNFLTHFIDYFKIHSYRKLKRMLIKERMWQLASHDKYKWYFRIENWTKRIFRIHE